MGKNMKNVMQKTTILLAAAFLLGGCQDKNKSYDAAGSFEATEVTVSAESVGRILNFDLQEGDILEKGDTLGAIDSLQLYLTKLQLQKSRKSVSSNKSDVATQIASLQEQLKKQMAEKERIERLLKDNAATQKQMDDVLSAIKVLENQMAARQSTLQKGNQSIDAQSSSIEMQIAQVDDKLSKCCITAPISGTVLNKYAEAGEFASVGKPLFRMADTDNLFLRTYFTSGQLMKIQRGQEVTVVANYGGDKLREYEGKIVWIAEECEFTPKNIQTQNDRENLVYAVKIAVRNDGYLKIGMYGNVKIKDDKGK